MRQHTTLALKRLATLLAVVAIALAALVAAPAPSYALTTSKATAKSNEKGGTGIIGGAATRLTWEGTVDEGEEVSSITLTLPEGSSFDGVTSRITVLDGLSREDADAEVEAKGSSITVDFAKPVAQGLLVRLELTNMMFPEAGGDISVGGTYTTVAGETCDLEESAPITVISNTPTQKIVNWLDEQPWVEAWNSNQFLGMFMKPQLIVSSLVALFPGWLRCLLIVVVAYPFAMLFGLLLALMRTSRTKIVRAIAICYVNLVRGTPFFLQIYIAFFGLPMVGVNIDNTILGMVVVALNSAAYQSEIFRAGIESIPVGQYEAASSLGMNRTQTMISIILPQTIRRVIPTVTSDFITSYKDTSLLMSVGVMEVMMFAKNQVMIAGNMTPYTTAAIFYLIITLPLIKVVGIIERRLATSEQGQAPRPDAAELEPASTPLAKEA